MTTASEKAAAILKAGKPTRGTKTASEIAAERLLGFDGRHVSADDIDDLIERTEWSDDDRKRALAAIREGR